MNDQYNRLGLQQTMHYKTWESIQTMRTSSPRPKLARRNKLHEWRRLVNTRENSHSLIGLPLQIFLKIYLRMRN